ncbi:MAG: DJ-1/PfpI family protein [Puniceicoccales bacterium]|jgi:4-methyl-5(b-hydroxyethyl)-thiazole monophosphate biosynthesis|nr:DJ-1/PfpI family protein [Puniceicoccales bacterium]
MLIKCKKSILVVLGEKFEEIELVIPVSIWRYARQTVTIASCTDSLSVRGVNGITVSADEYLKDAEVSSDILFLPGGNGCEALRKNALVLEKIHAYAKNKKLIAAICAAPLLLLDCGLLEGRRHTAYPCRELPSADHSVPVVLDDGILTGRDPGSVFAFALKLLQAIVCSQEWDEVHAHMRELIQGLGVKDIWQRMGNEL